MGVIKQLSNAALLLFSFVFVIRLSRYLHEESAASSVVILEARNSILYDADPISNVSRHLFRREDYTCGPGRPCANGACCGESGYCGYGSVYCGAGCVSNCDAVAECGKDASPPGKTCPLNTCCSQYGFCGTTEDFCTNGCQSNCNLHPAPPSGSPKGQSLSRVIGYYQSWADRLDCHKLAPSDLPLSELTHLNYAFAYIAPGSFEIVTMDSATPEHLFQLIVDTKQYNPDLRVFVSVGGWTFSDNGTATQPLFSEISSTAANRQKFADNVVRFMNRYGFDGLDIDWEYPGAPDRGGRPEDTQNFVALMRSLRATFDASPRELELTFTIPSSYWYLKWFDMPGLMKYADWTNLMSYDLHGVWDRNNPIGNIVQGHTNLTEIKLAAELLWRVGIKPSQVALGYGFYGRSFELSDPACSTPGCQFSGGARAGPCSATSGVLMFYEIQAMLDQVPALKPVYDKQAAVKYLVFDSNQWVSYDDAETFQQKVDWANSIGISGSLIWAADTDDSKYSALTGLLGKGTISHPNLQQKSFASTEITIIENLVGENGQDCKLMKDMGCVDPDIARCPNGQHKAGWDKDGCKSGGKLICCPAKTAPKKCQWRGSGGDCNGQCHPGEATLFRSSWGGGFKAQSGTNKCSRGAKVFCCEAGGWNLVTAGCYWTKCGQSCPVSDQKLATTQGSCSILFPSRSYCCPRDTPLHDCTWRGKTPDCADAKCKPDEVAIANDHHGDSFFGCSWGRKRTNCCKVSKPPPAQLMCDLTTCDLDPDACALEAVGGPTKRSDNGMHQLSKRGGPRDYWFMLPSQKNIFWRSISYTDPARYMQNLRNQMQGVARQWFVQRSRSCSDPGLQPADLNIAPNIRPPPQAQVEHPIPLVLLSRFLTTASQGRLWQPQDTAGRLLTGPRTNTPAIPTSFFENDLQRQDALPAGLPLVSPNSPDQRIPMNRLAERLGSNRNPSHFLLLQDSVNAIKGHVRNALNGGGTVRNTQREWIYYSEDESIDAFFSPLRETIAVFDYVRHPLTMERVDAIAAGIYQDLQLIELHIPAARGLSRHWNQFYPHYYQQISEFAQNWVRGRIEYVRRQLRNSNSPYRDHIEVELREIEDKIPDMNYPAAN